MTGLGYNHREVQTLLLAGEPLSSEQSAALQSHLETCQECREYAEFIQSLSGAFESSVPAIELSAVEKHRIARSISEQVERRRRPTFGSFGGFRTLAWTAVAVMLVIGLSWTVTTLLPQPAGQPATPAVATPAVATPEGPIETAEVTDKFITPIAPLPGGSGPYGYLRRAGFVNLENTRVLRRPVEQTQNELGVTVVQGVASPGRTEFWLDFQGERQQLDGAWLETVAGERLDLLAWDWPNSSNPNRLEGYVVFPELPQGMAQAVLALPDGWRLPVEFISPEEAGIPSSSVEPEACLEQNSLRVCVRAAYVEAARTSVLVEAEFLEPSGQLMTPLAFHNPYSEDNQPLLLTGSGQWSGWQFSGDTAPNPGLLQPAQEGPVLETIQFEPLPQEANRTVLHLPAVAVQVPLNAALQVNLGPDPQPGQSWTINQTVHVGELDIQFNQAMLSSDGNGGVQLDLVSEPVELTGSRMVTGLEIGRPARIEDRYGWGFDPATRRHTLTIGLTNPSGETHRGLMEIPVLHAQMILFGPFEVDWTVPASAPVTDPTPVQVGAESFAPPANPEPPRLGGISAPSRSLQSGEVFLASPTDGITELYTASSENGYQPELFASLPGDVYKVFIHPDRAGIDYVIGTGRTEFDENAIQEAFIYTWRFDGQPQLLIGAVLVLDMALWSAGGRNLLYTSRTAGFEMWEPFVVDLEACRLEPGTCMEQAQSFSWQQNGVNLGCPAWSTTSQRLAFCGVADNSNGLYDLYLADFEGVEGPLTGFPNLTNFTNSEEAAEAFGSTWLADGSGLVFVCEQASEINVFGICRQGLDESQSQVLATFDRSPAPLTLSTDGQWAVFLQPLENGGSQQLNLLNLQDGTVSALAEIGGASSLAFSPDGSQVLYASPQQGQAALVNPTSGEQISLAERLGEPVVWADWIP